MRGKTFSIMETLNARSREVTLDPGLDIDISDGDLTRLMRDQPGLMAWYAELLAEAKRQLREAKHQEKNINEDLDGMYRAKSQRDGKRRTETEIKKLIARNSKMRAAWRTRMDWEYKVDRLDGYVRALDHRLRALQSIGANTRRELDQTDST
jgi:hypothetical protein